MHPLIENNRDAITALCRRHGVRSLRVFGSVVREDFDDTTSDVDVLIEFQSQDAASFVDYLDFKEALEALFRRRVDLLERHTIRNRRLRRHIEQSSVPVYATA